MIVCVYFAKRMLSPGASVSTSQPRIWLTLNPLNYGLVNILVNIITGSLHRSDVNQFCMLTFWLTLNPLNYWQRMLTNFVC